jgi:hypothetical protein
MLVTCRLAGLSALETYYARVRAGAQCGADASNWPRRGASAHSWTANLPEAFPEPPVRLGGAANGRQAITSTLEKDAPPGVRSLTSAGGRGHAGQAMETGCDARRLSTGRSIRA